jgi:uncharacterized protein (TIGR03083 family)
MVDYLDALRRDGDALLHAAGTDPGADVPTCPGWSTTDLVAHVGRIYRYVARQARSQEQEPGDETPVAAGDEFGATADALAELLVVLTEVDPDAPAWNWDRDAPNVAGFWRRRMALETAVHRWDAQDATGTPAGFAADLACDGVDEVLRGFLPRRRGRSKEELTGTVHLHATDAPPGSPAEWTLDLGPRGAVAIRPVHEKADAAMRGPASDLFLAVWGRPAKALERFGDASLLAAARAQ